MAEEKNKVKVNIIKKAPQSAPSAPVKESEEKAKEENVEKKKVVVKLKAPVKAQVKPVVKVKENPPQHSSSAPGSIQKSESRPQRESAPKSTEPQKTAPRREVIDGKSFMGNGAHIQNTRIQSTIHSGPVIIHAQTPVENAPASDSSKPRVQGVVGGRRVAGNLVRGTGCFNRDG